ncbi:hypothetical protein LO772_08060 [Yinghuangia sp. ASG 101]|uniref:hypothetical protein n=1 Tax=Yinghuangia sp. ASG 101 TaxID=2896848 RepID=UPI001E59E8DD|nr:hypothetical protein [Yinghuangia sp. ASG 101]UGQ13548.1 hypothetical protein LO772_08060 [Yinghuangia sp. ASG 101]
MTRDPLLTPVRGSRIRAFLRHRLGATPTSVLVPADAPLGQRLTLAGLLSARSAYWVDTAERPAKFTCALPPDTTGLGRTAHITLVWWPHDARTVVRHRVFDGLVHIRRDVGLRLDKAAAANAQLPPAELEDALATAVNTVAPLNDIGLSYDQVHLHVVQQTWSEARRNELDAVHWEIAAQEAKQHLARIQLDYHRTLVREGPEALLAYWLQHRPDDIAHIVEQVRKHPPAPETPSAAEQNDRHLLGLLTGLTGHERERVRALVAFAVAGRSGPEARKALADLGLLDESAFAVFDRSDDEEQPWP